MSITHVPVAGFDADIFSGEVDKEERMNIVDRFQDPNSNTFIMLVSTMAGGVGLNLTAVSFIAKVVSDVLRPTKLLSSIPIGVSAFVHHYSSLIVTRADPDRSGERPTSHGPCFPLWPETRCVRTTHLLS